MELEEMKNVWASVDERLKKQEMVNSRMVQEMLHKKSSKSLNWLANYEMFNMIVSLLAIPLLVFLYNNYPVIFTNLSAKVIIVSGIVVCVLGAIWSWYILKNYVMKMDFSKNIKDNMHYMNKYNILIGKGKFVNYFIIIPFLTALLAWYYYEFKAPFSVWILLLVFLAVVTAATYWIYKKIYEKNIQSIKKSLEELEELKEEK